MKQEQLNDFLETSSKDFEVLNEIPHLETRKIIGDLRRVITKFKEGSNKLIENNSLLCIGIVGQMNSGKSTFLNSLLFDGDSLLPKAATPMTAGLTVIEYTPQRNYIEVQYFSTDEWEIFKVSAKAVEEARKEILRDQPELESSPILLWKAIEQKTSEIERASNEMVCSCRPEALSKLGQMVDIVEFDTPVQLQTTLRKYVGVGGKYTSVVKSLNIFLNDKRIEGLRIVDTPGVNDPVISREVRTHEFLQEAHGVIMLSFSDHFLPQQDIDFMNKRIRSVGIGSVLLLGSRFDNALRSPQTFGMPLSNAVAEVSGRLRNLFDEKKLLIANPSVIVGVEFTSSISYAINEKLKAANWKIDEVLDKDEKSVFDALKKHFPCDFGSPEAIDKSLDLLANLINIYNNYLKTTFISKKDQIIDEKLEGYHREQSEVILKGFSLALISLKKEREFLNTNDIAELEAQISMCEEIFQNSSEKIQNRLNRFSADLQGYLKSLRNTELANKRPSIDFIPSEYFECSYTRKGTLLGLSKKGKHDVLVVNRNSTINSEQAAMDRYWTALRDKWRSKFLELKKALTDELLDAITQIATEMMLKDSFYRIAIEKSLENDLNGEEELDLINIIDKYKSDLKTYVNESVHTNFSTAFGKVTEEDANKNLDAQARSLLEEIRQAIELRNNGFVRDLDSEADAQVQHITEKISDLSDNLVTRLTNDAIILGEQKKADLRSKADSLSQIERAEDIVLKLKKQFNSKV